MCVFCLFYWNVPTFWCICELGSLLSFNYNVPQICTNFSLSLCHIRAPLLMMALLLFFTASTLFWAADVWSEPEDPLFYIVETGKMLFVGFLLTFWCILCDSVAVSSQTEQRHKNLNKYEKEWVMCFYDLWLAYPFSLHQDELKSCYWNRNKWAYFGCLHTPMCADRLLSCWKLGNVSGLRFDYCSCVPDLWSFIYCLVFYTKMDFVKKLFKVEVDKLF